MTVDQTQQLANKLVADIASLRAMALSLDSANGVAPPSLASALRAVADDLQASSTLLGIDLNVVPAGTDAAAKGDPGADPTEVNEAVASQDQQDFESGETLGRTGGVLPNPCSQAMINGFAAGQKQAAP